MVMQLDRKRIEGACVEWKKMEKKVVTSYEKKDKGTWVVAAAVLEHPRSGDQTMGSSIFVWVVSQQGGACSVRERSHKNWTLPSLLSCVSGYLPVLHAADAQRYGDADSEGQEQPGRPIEAQCAPICRALVLVIRVSVPASSSTGLRRPRPRAETRSACGDLPRMHWISPLDTHASPSCY